MSMTRAAEASSQAVSPALTATAGIVEKRSFSFQAALGSDSGGWRWDCDGRLAGRRGRAQRRQDPAHEENDEGSKRNQGEGSVYVHDDTA